jgi:hypothetical protein
VPWDEESGGGGGPPAAHAPTHVSGGSDEIDGDSLDIDFSPTNYVGGATLIAHLSGIDSALVGGDAGALIIPVRKASAGSIPARTPVYVAGWNAGLGVVEVEAADAAGAGTMPSVGMANVAITNSATINLTASGRLLNVDTSGAAAEGDPVYVASGGGVQYTRPTGATVLVQKLGEVLRKHPGLGVILVVGAGRVNDLSNLTTARIWEGDGTGVAVEVDPAGRYAPASHASTHEPGGGDAMAVDAAVATGSLRTVGQGTATSACADNDARLSDARTPTGTAGGDLNGTYPNPGVDDGADGTAIHDNQASEISAVTLKGTPVSGDLLLIEDSAAANAKKRITVGSLPSGGGGGSGLLEVMRATEVDSQGTLSSTALRGGLIIPAADITVTTCHFSVQQAGGGGSTAGVGIYDSSGNLVTNGSATGISTSTTGYKTGTFGGGGAALTAGTRYYLMLTTSDTNTQYARKSSPFSWNQVPYGATNGTVSTGGTPPASTTISATNQAIPWLAISA